MPFELPEDLAGVTNEELSNLIEQARDEFNTLNDSDDISDETLERMEYLAVSIEDVQAEKARRNRRSELAARVAESEPEIEAEAEEEVVEAAAEETEVVEASEEETVEDDSEERLELALAETEVVEAEVEEEVTEAAAEEEAVVEAATEEASEVVVSEIVSNNEKESLVAASPNTSIPENTRPQVLIAAAQDVPQFYVGQRLDPALLADAIHNKARMLSDSRGSQIVYPVATIERPFGEGYDLEGLDQASTWDRLAEKTSPNSLVAAGGWCAPSETVYDLFEVECENDVLFQIPTFRVTRGGIRWPVFAAHDETFNPGFVWTEANDQAATAGTPTKPCVRISCPTFTECRLDATGLCVTAGNLIDRAYPEQVRWYLNRAVRAYERNNAARKLNLVLADTSAVVIPSTFGAGSALVSALLLLANDYRQVNGLCASETLDIVLPYWVTDIVKADVARQEGTLSIGNLPTDADVSAWFRAAGLNLRYISHWQYFAAHPATAWPGSVQALIGYPGSYVEFNQGRLDLGVIRDSVLNSTNDFTALWFEEFYCVGRRGPQHYLATIPLCPDGSVGQHVTGPITGICP